MRQAAERGRWNGGVRQANNSAEQGPSGGKQGQTYSECENERGAPALGGARARGRRMCEARN